MIIIEIYRNLMPSGCLALPLQGPDSNLLSQPGCESLPQRPHLRRLARNRWVVAGCYRCFNDQIFEFKHLLFNIC